MNRLLDPSTPASNPIAASSPHPRLRVDFGGASDALLRFGFADPTDAVRVRCERLAGPTTSETWHASADFKALVLERTEAAGDIGEAARSSYAELIAGVRGSSHPYLLRIWNYLGDINLGEGDAERYRHFCVGRAGAVDAEFNNPPPAATAIGHDGGAGTLQVVALCSRSPGIALENPRQTPAWSYPRAYGPVAPGFSRGALTGSGDGSPTLLASGTASIVGHVSQHVGDVAEQLRESLRNLDALLAVGNERSGHVFALRGCEAMRIYLRYPADLMTAQEVIAAAGLPEDRVLFVRGDVCRRELDVELEGVFAAD